MSTITTKDGTQIYYKDWGTGPTVTFSHGWPLNADMWDSQMLFLSQNGFRVVAHDHDRYLLNSPFRSKVEKSVIECKKRPRMREEL